MDLVLRQMGREAHGGIPIARSRIRMPSFLRLRYLVQLGPLAEVMGLRRMNIWKQLKPSCYTGPEGSLHICILGLSRLTAIRDTQSIRQIFVRVFAALQGDGVHLG